MKPTYEELEAKLLETNTKLLETDAKLLEAHRLLKLAIERITALQEQINKNSNNSSKPPYMFTTPVKLVAMGRIDHGGGFPLIESDYSFLHIA